MARIERDGEVGAATDFVGCVNGLVEALFEVRADGGDEMPTSGEAEVFS